MTVSHRASPLSAPRLDQDTTYLRKEEDGTYMQSKLSIIFVYYILVQCKFILVLWQ